MSNERALDTEVAIAALRMFPQKVRSSILDDSEFRDRFALGVDAVIKFANGGAEFARSALFRAVRQVLSGVAPSSELKSKDGTVWRVTDDSAQGIIVSRESAVVSLPEF